MTFPCCSSCGQMLRAHERDNGLCDSCDWDEPCLDLEPDRDQPSDPDWIGLGADAPFDHDHDYHLGGDEPDAA